MAKAYITSIRLELTRDEAQTLYNIVSHTIIGTSQTSTEIKSIHAELHKLHTDGVLAADIRPWADPDRDPEIL